MNFTVSSLLPGRNSILDKKKVNAAGLFPGKMRVLMLQAFMFTVEITTFDRNWKCNNIQYFVVTAN